jgi:opacity protein-like surface antigen
MITLKTARSLAIVSAAIALQVYGGQALAQAATDNAPKFQFVPYLRLDAGYAFSDKAGGNIVTGSGFGNDFGKGFVGGGGLGVKLAKSGAISIRFDVTGSTTPSLSSNHTGSLADGTVVAANVKTDNTTILGNLYADIDTGWAITPFIGVGVGSAHNKVKTLTFTNPAGAFAQILGSSTTSTAWTVTAGGSYTILPNFIIDLGYRYTDAGLVNTSTSFTDLTLHIPKNYTLDNPISSKLNFNQVYLSARISF